jgi:hypothetical protein
MVKFRVRVRVRVKVRVRGAVCVAGDLRRLDGIYSVSR